MRVFGAPLMHWRIVPEFMGLMRVQAREFPIGAWIDQSIEEVALEISHQTEVGQWLKARLARHQDAPWPPAFRHSERPS